MAGNNDQSNCYTVNSYQDALANHRVSAGLNVTAADQGMILSVGVATKNQDSMANLHKSGFNSLNEAEFHVLLNAL